MQSIKILALLISLGSFHAVQATSLSSEEDGQSSTSSSDDDSSTSSSDDEYSTESSDDSFGMRSTPFKPFEENIFSSMMTKEHFQPFKESIFSSIKKGILSPINVKGELYDNQYNLLFKVTKEEFDKIVATTGLKRHFQADQEGLMDLILESGNFGQVRIAQDLETGKYVAVKITFGDQRVKESLKVGDMQQRLAGEPHVLHLFDRLNYTSARDTETRVKLLKKAFGHTNGQNEALLLQFFPLGSFGNGEELSRFLSFLNDDDLKEKIVTHVAYAFVTGLMNMHNKGVSHLDFKLANLLLSWQGDVWVSGMDCALQKKILSGGFGDRRKFSPERLDHVDYLAEKQKNPGNIKANDPRKFYSGHAADSFAAGLAIRELMTGNHLSQDLFDQKQEGLFKVINELLLPNPEERWSMVQAQKALRKLLPKESPQELFAQFEQALLASGIRLVAPPHEEYIHCQYLLPKTKDSDETDVQVYGQDLPVYKKLRTGDEAQTPYTDLLEEGMAYTDIPDDDEPHYTDLPDYDHNPPPRRNGKGNPEKTEWSYYCQ